MKNNLLLTLSMISLAMAGIFIKACEADSFSIIFFRLLFSLILILPFSFSSTLKMLKQSSSKEKLTMIFMGFLFVLHFYFWISSLNFATIANATMGFALQPLFMSLGAYAFFKEKPNKNFAFAFVMGLIGLTFILKDELHFESQELIGTGLAFLASQTFVIYFLMGKRMREKYNAIAFMNLIYGAALALSLVPLFILGKTSLNSLPPMSWLMIVLIALVPTILGHCNLIHLAGHFKASTISTFVLTQPMIATLCAYWVYHEPIYSNMLIGYALIVLGLLAFIYQWNFFTKVRRSY